MSERSRADELIGELGLVPHPEGGHYREVYRSTVRVDPVIASTPGATENAEQATEQPRPVAVTSGGHSRSPSGGPSEAQSGCGGRSALTCIYFLLRAGEVSRWHVVGSDEVWTLLEGSGSGTRSTSAEHTGGSALELITFDPRDEQRSGVEIVQLAGVDKSSVAMHVVPAGVWQCARPLGDYALVSCAVAPGFEFEDFAFVSDLPGHRSMFDNGPLSAYEALL